MYMFPTTALELFTLCFQPFSPVIYYDVLTVYVTETALRDNLHERNR